MSVEPILSALATDPSRQFVVYQTLLAKRREGAASSGLTRSRSRWHATPLAPSAPKDVAYVARSAPRDDRGTA